MSRQVQFLTSTSVRGAAVYASGEVAAFEDAIAADLIARDRAVAWPIVEVEEPAGFSVFADAPPVAEGFSVFVDPGVGPPNVFSVFVDPNAEVVTDPRAIAAAMEDTVDDVEPVDPPAAVPPTADSAVTNVAAPPRRRGRGARQA